MRLKYELRDWQRKAFSAWQLAGNRGIVEVATGGGKTVLAEACIESLMKDNANIIVAIVVPTTVLLDQWYASLIDELGCLPTDIGLFGGGKQGPPKKLNIFVVNSARERLPLLCSKHSIFMIADECHRYGGEENRKALEGKTVASLGLSATPERQYDDALTQVLVPSLGEIIFRYSLIEARRDGVLSPFELINVAIKLLPDEQQNYDRLSKRIGFLSSRHRNSEGAPTSNKDMPKNLESALRARARVSANATMRIPTAVSLVERHPGQRCIVFHEDIASADIIVRNLQERGHAVTTYHSKVSPAFRRTNLLQFRQGIYRVLVSCRALDEGLNVPETQVAVIASSTATTRQRIQRLGRVLRPSDGKSKAVVYTIFGTRPERERLSNEESELEDIASIRWMKLSN